MSTGLPDENLLHVSAQDLANAKAATGSAILLNTIGSGRQASGILLGSTTQVQQHVGSVNIENDINAEIEAKLQMYLTRRPPVLRRQIIRVPGPAGRVQQVVRRLPTPQPDVIEKVTIVKPQRDVINLVIEKPGTPPPQVQERREVEAASPPVINQQIVRVEPRTRAPQIQVAPPPIPQPAPQQISVPVYPTAYQYGYQTYPSSYSYSASVQSGYVSVPVPPQVQPQEVAPQSVSNTYQAYPSAYGYSAYYPQKVAQPSVYQAYPSAYSYGTYYPQQVAQPNVYQTYPSSYSYQASSFKPTYIPAQVPPAQATFSQVVVPQQPEPQPQPATFEIDDELNAEIDAKLQSYLTRREPVLKRQVIRVAGPAGKVQQIVRRLPTPQPDVIEKVFVTKPQRDVINLVIEKPGTPPPQVQERREVEPTAAPVINQQVVRVEPRTRAAQIQVSAQPQSVSVGAYQTAYQAYPSYSYSASTCSCNIAPQGAATGSYVYAPYSGYGSYAQY